MNHFSHHHDDDDDDENIDNNSNSDDGSSFLKKLKLGMSELLQEDEDVNTCRKVKRKHKGDLSFKANFESGNLSRVRVVQRSLEYDLFIRPDSNNPAHRLWFYFSVQNVRKDQRVLLTICNFSKSRSLYREGMTPLVKSTSRPHFERIPQKQVYYYRSPRHNNNYVLSFLFTFDNEKDEYFFAYCYPYTYTDLQRFLFHAEAQAFPYLRRELLGLSVQRRRLDLLTITSPKNMSQDTKQCPTVFISARVHPGETPSSIVCHGVISFLLSNHPSAKLLRKHIIFKILPMINPDGVFLGNYRCSSMGYDLNRQYLNPSGWAHPEIVATRNYLLALKDDPNMDFDMLIDIHSHSTAQGGFMFVNHANSFTEREDARLYPRLLGARAKEFSVNDTKVCKNPKKLGTSRRALGELLKVARHCYTLEVSFFSYMDANSKPVPFTESNYLDLGRNICLTFLDYYNLSSSSSSSRTASSSSSTQEQRLIQRRSRSSVSVYRSSFKQRGAG